MRDGGRATIPVDHPNTRNFLDLLDFPLALSQRPLLRAEDFERDAKRRGTFLSSGSDLSELHRLGVLVPVLEVVRDVREARREVRDHPGLAWDLFNQSPPVYAPELRAARAAGRVHLTRMRPFRSIAQRTRRFGEVSYFASDYLYSVYQLLLLPAIQDARHWAPFLGHRSNRGEWARSTIDAIRRAHEQFERVILMLTALEPYYWPRQAGKLSLPVHYGPLEQWWIERERLDTEALLDWAGWSSDALQETAEGLITRAWGVDPLRRWLDLVQLVHPEHWERLEDKALLAVDLRRAAEMLLQFHADLQHVGVAPPLPTLPPRAPHPLNERLNADRGRTDAVLTDFGLSPHPSVLLVFEGATEVLVATRLMPLLGMSERDPYLRILELGGIDKDPELLAKYVRPSLRRFNEEAAEFETPPLRMVLVMDGDGKAGTPAAREQRRQRWVKRYHDALPSEFHGPATVADLGEMVVAETWTADPRDFELAHFAPRTLAVALLETGFVPSHYTRSRLQAEISVARAAGKGLRTVWRSWPDRRGLKMQLWQRLLPRLERRLRSADYDRATHTPIARVLLGARDLARRPRSGILLRVGTQTSAGDLQGES